MSPETCTHPFLRSELIDLAARDRQMRSEISRRYQHPDQVTEADQQWWMEVEAANTARLKAIIAQYQWPGRSMIGDDGEHALWVLVLHADSDVAFQSHCLTRLRIAVAQGEADAEQVAFLTDRVCMNLGQPQFYGTQMQMINGEVLPWPIQDEDHVDDRRAAAGMAPLHEYIASIRG